MEHLPHVLEHQKQPFETPPKSQSHSPLWQSLLQENAYFFWFSTVDSQNSGRIPHFAENARSFNASSGRSLQALMAAPRLLALGQQLWWTMELKQLSDSCHGWQEFMACKGRGNSFVDAKLNLVGGIPIPLKHMSQLGWWKSQSMGK